MSQANTEYVLEYEHDGTLWALNFFAVDDADAERKVSSIRRTLELKGRLLGTGQTLHQALEAAAETAAAETLRGFRR